MIFVLYVHTNGPGGLLKQVGSKLSKDVGNGLLDIDLTEIDCLGIGLQSVSLIENGFKLDKKRVRRNYRLRLPTGVVEFYRCMVECDFYLPDALVLEIEEEAEMRAYLLSSLVKMLPVVLDSFPASDLLTVKEVLQRIC